LAPAAADMLAAAARSRERHQSTTAMRRKEAGRVEDRGHSLVKAFACDACWVRVSVGSASPARDAVDAG
jgi:hypothetical protein